MPDPQPVDGPGAGPYGPLHVLLGGGLSRLGCGASDQGGVVSRCRGHEAKSGSACCPRPCGSGRRRHRVRRLPGRSGEHRAAATRQPVPISRRSSPAGNCCRRSWAGRSRGRTERSRQPQVRYGGEHPSGDCFAQKRAARRSGTVVRDVGRHTATMCPMIGRNLLAVPCRDDIPSAGSTIRPSGRSWFLARGEDQSPTD